MDLIAAQMEQAYPADYHQIGFVLVPADAELIGSLGRLFFLLLCAVSLVLLIACVNVANLLLVRATERDRQLPGGLAGAVDGGALPPAFISVYERWPDRPACCSACFCYMSSLRDDPFRTYGGIAYNLVSQDCKTQRVVFPLNLAR
jgi:hypothetical protein